MKYAAWRQRRALPEGIARVKVTLSAILERNVAIEGGKCQVSAMRMNSSHLLNILTPQIHLAGRMTNLLYGNRLRIRSFRLNLTTRIVSGTVIVEQIQPAETENVFRRGPKIMMHLQPHKG